MNGYERRQSIYQSSGGDLLMMFVRVGLQPLYPSPVFSIWGENLMIIAHNRGPAKCVAKSRDLHFEGERWRLQSATWYLTSIRQRITQVLR
nr:hypothetical protein [Escherichia coli]